MSYVFFLGGQDLEMLTIRKFLEEKGQEFFDKRLEWGAKASFYTNEILQAAMEDKVPVLVELERDCPLPESTILIDHHGERSGEESSLFQVFKLLGNYANSYEDRLITANDSGYIPAMQAMGATQEWIDEIRRRDREAQGVTKEMEEQAVEALRFAERRKEVVIVRLPHAKFSPVSDRLFPIWPDGKENLLVVTNDVDGSFVVYYFGRGDICRAMKEVFTGFGGGQGFGDPLKNGFAGCRKIDPDAVEDVINFVVARQ